MHMKEPTRPYVQRRRAEATAATAERILEASAELLLHAVEDLTLEAVAERAGVSVQTILRRFGSKEGLTDATIRHVRPRVRTHRDAAPVGDVAGAVETLLVHYAGWGEFSLRMLSIEARSATAAAVVREGRAYHRAWVERVFAPALAGLDPATRGLRVTQLVVVTDVYTWKLLRLDLGLEGHALRHTIEDLVRHLLP